MAILFPSSIKLKSLSEFMFDELPSPSDFAPAADPDDAAAAAAAPCSISHPLGLQSELNPLLPMLSILLSDLKLAKFGDFISTAERILLECSAKAELSNAILWVSMAKIRLGFLERE